LSLLDEKVHPALFKLVHFISAIWAVGKKNCLDLGANTTYSLRATNRMVLKSRLDGCARNISGRKAIKVQGRGWNANDIFKDFYVFNEIKHEKAPKYFVMHANETSLEDLQQGQQACFVFLKTKDKVTYFLILHSSDYMIYCRACKLHSAKSQAQS
jgi:hypothetical protein